MFQVERILNQQDYTAPDGSKPQGGEEMEDAIFWLDAPPDSSRLAWTWAGEWTVTYETFRDMGAAFGVALVLIYVLVVWEFGNFRIPLVIMAPIPLTLLGIIPAHWAAFQLGLGGEFTATSMIGWIALAGIIVRNSILLVDFSINEVQKGVPVAEAVIRSCTTRTRPIVITALALVAGSSVIFSDPIFQGMAISLSSGVLVSTLLTLIVIPLGCVAASKDLCEVAVASAPAGMVVPCAEGLDGGESGRREAASEVPPRQGRLGAALAKLGSVLMLIFYAFRGLFLLLFDWIKGRIEKRRKTQGAAAPLPNALRRAETPRQPEPEPEPEPNQAGAEKTVPETTTVKDEGQPAETAPSASEGRGAVTAKKAAAKKATAKKAASKKASTKKASAQEGAAAAAQKKVTKGPSRRGIRLKNDDS
jgi:hypothetical protein